MANENPPPLPTQDPFSFRDTNSLRFLAQFFFSTLILGFCLIQLSRPKTGNENTALYWSCLSGILALWMPSPATSRASSSSGGEPFSLPNSNSIFVSPPPETLDGKSSQQQEVTSRE